MVGSLICFIIFVTVILNKKLFVLFKELTIVSENTHCKSLLLHIPF
jgi:hypothetical protein